MKSKFVNRYKFNDKLIKEYVLFIMSKKLIITGLITTLIGIILYIVLDENVRYVMITAAIISAIATILTPILYIKNLQDTSKLMNPEENYSEYTFYEDKVVLNEGKTNLEINYDNIKSIKKSKNIIALMLINGGSIVLLRSGFVNSSEKDFLDFIEKKLDK